MTDPLETFDGFRKRLSELHTDLVMKRWADAVNRIEEIKKAFEDLRLEIRNNAAEVELTTGSMQDPNVRYERPKI